ncbi:MULTISPECIES: cellobiose phosphorylase [unclassified Clostridium]|uniref:GH36-type glycosyl hydrolase domain-containing protein n=1 Tax=unclassified Clostridium TaxID=2614128 RepID=UPI000297B4A4|nr:MULTISPECIES: cellobiose phosphorylase [unclassified Clostridium]EKQ57683.1 MAG: cellobiose phosphorylase [Clostridium sp. Maddingley MBC34-26]
MANYEFLNSKGTFRLKNPENNSYMYFPLANEAGVMSSITPTLNGDCKMGQNTFLLAPVSSEDLHNNKSSRNFWVYIDGAGAWSASGISAAQQSEIFSEDKEETELEAGIMWHKMIRISKKYGIKSEIISFVPATDDKVELMKVTVTNMDNVPKRITPTAAIPLYCRSADNIRDHRHVTSLLHRIKTTEYGIVVNPTLTFDERGHKKNTVVYGAMAAKGNGEKPIGFCPLVEDFIGEGGSFEIPQTVVLNEEFKVKANSNIEGYEAIGAIRFEDEIIEAGESKTYIVAIGFGNSESDFSSIVDNHLTETAFDGFLEETKAYWNKKINISYETKNKQFDNWMYWVNFQPMLRRIYGCSFLPHHDYGKGGRGWRDLWQDCLALLAMDPSNVRGMLLDNFGGVRFDGTNATIIGTKQGEFIADRNNITRVWMDHGAWPFLTTKLYIEQTGDIEFLLEKQSYFKDLQEGRGTEKDLLWNAKQGNKMLTHEEEEHKGTILEHILIQHLTAFYDVGEHNNLKLRGADWNDGLDMADEKGESVAFSALYGGNLSNIAELLKYLRYEKNIKNVELAEELLVLLTGNHELYENIEEKRKVLEEYCLKCRHNISGKVIGIDCDELISNIEGKAEWLKNHIQKNEWIINKEGYRWYNGYYDNNARRVEGDGEHETRMMLTGQVFTIMSSIATEEQVKSIVKAADKYLYDESVGGYRLNTNFNEVKTDLGRMFGFAYGHKENGAVFSHMAIMYANALYQRCFAEEGFKVIDTLYNHCNNFKVSRIYPGVPEYINQKGRGMYHYLTGSASWLILTVLSEMFGVKGEMGDLAFNPKLLEKQFNEENKATIEMTFAERKLRIEYVNDNRKEYGNYSVNKIYINGKEYKFNGKSAINRATIIELDKNGKHIIKIILN